MLKILIATNNPHKAQELAQILPLSTNAGRPVQYMSLADFPNIPEPREDGQTLQENAIIKARAGLAATGLISIADDTGLLVDALGGAPGVHSGRYAYPDKTDHQANNAKLLDVLAEVPPAKRAARFITIAAMAKPDGEIIIRKGAVEGSIAVDYSGQNGFGYDPLFIVASLGKTMARLSMEEKNKISHRALAFAQMAEIIKNF
ncbi:MAG: RdgB/HAM1 family non-canonical purine NTP pyrophosphatase [Elusimicrobiota bacterium]|jgi:XTP/dITP diphosphohydrolase|nr:RdgB/HAM1 family non-canonical purine NTP pyrophosphatase [Elusimicrobiota bacterium]